MNRDRIRKISIVGLLILAVTAFVYFAMIRRQARHEMAMGQAAAGKDVYYCPMHKNYHSDKPGSCPICSMKLVKLEAAPAPASSPQEGAIFVAPEKQQLIGMRSVTAETGTLTKEIRIEGEVAYDETRLTHIHSK